MRTALRKSVRDISRGRARTLMVVLAIAIGLASFQAVLSTHAILRREITTGYLATNPPSAVIGTGVVDEELLTAIRARADIADADARGVLTGQIRTRSGASRPFRFFVIRDFTRLRIASVTPEGGEWPPKTGAVLIERDAFQVAGAGLGETISITTAAGHQRTLRVSGGVHDPGQAQARMEHLVYGYITAGTATMLGASSPFDRLYLLASSNRSDHAHVAQVAADVKAWVETNGHAVRWMDVPRPGTHPHADIMEVLLLSISAFGLLAVALAGVIAMNLLLSMMAAERRQIGVMKAIGGSRGQIARVYLAEAALLGITATAIGVPAGIAAGRVLSRYFGVLLNFDITSVAVPPWVYLLVVVVGILVPLAAAVYPIAKGTTVSAREAITTLDADPATFGGRRFDRMLCAISVAGRPWLFGVRNLARRRGRTITTLTVFALAGTFFILAMNARASMMATAERLAAKGTDYAFAVSVLDSHMLMIYAFLLIVAALIACVGGLGLATATSLNVLDRRRELGVLRAIGASPAAIARVVVIESIGIATLSWALAVLAASAMTALMGYAVGTMPVFRGQFAVRWPLSGPAGWLTIAIVLAVLASLVPALMASRRSIPEALAYE